MYAIHFSDPLIVSRALTLHRNFTCTQHVTQCYVHYDSFMSTFMLFRGGLEFFDSMTFCVHLILNSVFLASQAKKGYVSCNVLVRVLVLLVVRKSPNYTVF